MSRVALLTRPWPVHDGVAETLHVEGMDSLSLPTLKVNVYVDDVFEQHLMMQNYDGVIYVSQHAVAFAADRLKTLNKHFTPKTWFAAVGMASGFAIRQTWPDVRVIMPALNDTQDSDGLWRALNDADLLKPKSKILIVRAQTGRDLLLTRLRRSELIVDVWACYRRVMLRWDDSQRQSVLKALQRKGLVISITSVGGLHGLLDNLAPISAKLWRQPVITLHPAISQAALQQGFTQVHHVLPHEMSAALLAHRD